MEASLRRSGIRYNQNNLLNYLIHDKRDLSPSYVRSCEKFFKEISLKHQASSTKHQAAGSRRDPEILKENKI